MIVGSLLWQTSLRYSLVPELLVQLLIHRKVGYVSLNPLTNTRQPYQHHTRIPNTGIYVYSFALNPEQHQPSGTVNMSRIDNATLILNLTTGTDPVKLRLYAVNYNVLRVMAGIKMYIIHLCQTVNCLSSCSTTWMGKQCKVGHNQVCSWLSYNWLVISMKIATTSNCGKLLRASTTISIRRLVERTRLMTDPTHTRCANVFVHCGNNVEDWIIRSQIWLVKKGPTRRFRDYMELGDNCPLRYSPAPPEIGEGTNSGVGWHIVTRCERKLLRIIRKEVYFVLIVFHLKEQLSNNGYKENVLLCW